MNKRNYEFEFEINASPKLLFPYFSTPGGLEQWFSDKVEIDADNIWNIVWDDEDHFAKITSQKILKSIKFEFLDENKKPVKDPSTLEFAMVKNEMTETHYLHIAEYLESDAEEQDQYELWESIVEELKAIVGG
jgi:uncharacterized protein YndB with AHSA1/START domain